MLKNKDKVIAEYKNAIDKQNNRLKQCEEIINKLVSMLREKGVNVEISINENDNNSPQHNPPPTPAICDNNDINVIIDQTNCTKDVAEKALQKHNGDVVDAILNISENPDEFNEPQESQLPVENNDVQVIMDQTNCTKDVATKALQKHNGDVVDAILNINEIPNDFK